MSINWQGVYPAVTAQFNDAMASRIDLSKFNLA